MTGPRPTPHGPGGADVGGEPADRTGRTDPAAMRAELDAARRNLGAAPPVDPVRSAERQRALLREAAAREVSPADGPARPDRRSSPRAPDPER